MIKVKLLLHVISDLRSLADSLQALADGMGENEGSARSATATQHEVDDKSAAKLDSTTQEELKTEGKPSKQSVPKKQNRQEDEKVKQSSKKVADKEQSTLDEEKKEKKSSKKIASKKQYTLEEVRGLLAEKSQSGFTAEVKALIEKYGGNKLSHIKPEDYEAMMKEAKVLGDE